jgi:nucleoid DNA-binding protein
MNFTLFKNQLYAKKGDPAFVARGRITRRIMKEQIIEKIAYACTLTDADIGAVLASLEKAIVEYLVMGCSIELGFLSIAFSIKGGFDNDDDNFQKGRNWVALNATVSSALVNAVNQRAKPEKVVFLGNGPRPLKIIKVTGDTESVEFQAGNLVRITGAKLTFDREDDKCGVFLLSENAPVRVSEYSKIGSTAIDLKMPDGLTVGDNELEIRTRKADGSILKGTLEAPILIAA